MKQHTARYFEKRDSGHIKCFLCPHNCVIAAGKKGICGTRRNTGETLVTDIYGQVTAIAMDPIEKKPLYHFHPGSRILSIGTKGCNMACPYCQNWHIFQDLAASATYYEPESIIEAALKNNSVGIAYTYSEPIIWIEYVMDVAMLAQDAGLLNVMVTNGFAGPEAWNEFLTVTSAMNIDLKSFREGTYRKVQKAELSAVKSRIIEAYEAGVHIELTTLIVTGMDDDIGEMRDIIDFISGIDSGIPWHISRYFPNYKYHQNATDIAFLEKVRDIAMESLKFVYCGNCSVIQSGNDTICPSCGGLIISRHGYQTRIVDLSPGGLCGSCGESMGVIF